MEEFRQKIRLEHCQVSREQKCVLPDNYKLSLKRLNGLIRRLHQSPDVLHEYHAVIQDQLQKGISEPVKDPLTSAAGRVHYLPHHAVIRKDK